jgi:hypothetical protein
MGIEYAMAQSLGLTVAQYRAQTGQCKCALYNPEEECTCLRGGKTYYSFIKPPRRKY